VQQRVEEQVGIVLDRADRIGTEQLGKHAGHEGCGSRERRDTPLGAAAVVLQHEELAAVVADDVGTDHVRVDAARRPHVEQLALVFLAREEQPGRQHAVLEALLLAIDVGDEEVEGGDALDQPRLQPLPLARGHDARHEVEREDPLQPFLLAVDRERDALVHERELLQPLAAADLALGERLEHADDALVVSTRIAVAIEGFVERRAAVVHPLHGARE